MKQISVIISTYSIKRVRFVIDCIKSLIMQTKKPNEILLVLDPINDLVDYYKKLIPENIKIEISSGFGLSKARNSGIKKSTGEIIAFIDDDAVAEKNWIKNLVKNFNNPNVVGVGGKVIPIWVDRNPRWFPSELYWILGCSYKGLPNKRSIIRNPIGCNMAFHKQIFNKVGYFKQNIGRIGEKLISAEETELSLRITTKFPEYKIIYDPESIVYHNVKSNRINLLYIIKRSFYEGYSKSLIIKKYSKHPNFLSSEKTYLFLIIYSIINKLFNLNFNYMLQIITLLISTFFVFIGFFFGKSLMKFKT
jgi:glycosyltransferase involved in cell wall biosynthesis